LPLGAGDAFGPYDVVEPLGSGGMATVFKARERALDRFVALKTLPHDALGLSNFAERFEREAKIVARLEHASIVPIFGYGITESVPWMAMRYISGGSVARRIRSGTIELRQAADIVRDVAEALDYAHERAILHCDVKPQNMLLDESGRAYLTDFGVARIMAGHPRLTSVGSVAGTPEYMAPEQATGAEPDLRLDVYALGTVVYQMLTGRTPFGGDAPLVVLKKQVSAPVPVEPLSAVPPAVRQVVLRCLAKSPSERFNRAGAFAAALEAAVGTLPTDEPTVVVSSASSASSLASPSSPPHAGPSFDPTLIAPRPVVRAPSVGAQSSDAAAARPARTNVGSQPAGTRPRSAGPPSPGYAAASRPGLTAAHLAIIVLTALFGLGLLGLTSYLVLRAARPGAGIDSSAPAHTAK
jgi:serine/threonine protein kinase